MLRVAVALALWSAACGRSQGVPDEALGDLVIAPKASTAPIAVDRAAHEPGELGRALGQPLHLVIANLGPHTVKLEGRTIVEEGGQPVTDLGEETAIELGDAEAFHAVYTNTADYGREVTYAAGRLFLRPRYQRWHGRAPESADEPSTLRDQFFEPIAATWDLLAPGAELADQGAVQVAGRPGRKIAIKLSPHPATAPVEPLTQRKWREHRAIEELVGEVVLDVGTGAPLAVKLAGTVAFSRDGRRFRMKTSLSSSIAAIGTAVAIAAPPDGDVVATPERLREVDDRDYLLDGIAPPLRKGADGTAVPPQPRGLAPTKTPPTPPAPAPTAAKAAPK